MGDKQYITKLLEEIEELLQWGESKHWTGRDFENLVDKIYLKTDHKLSVTTLKRLWGRSSQDIQPSITTLDILSEFLDYGPWREFIKHHSIQPKLNSSFNKSLLLVILLAFIAMTIVYLKKRSPSVNLDEVQFIYSKQSQDVPNSVYFEYDLGEHETNDASIQLTGMINDEILIEKSQGSAGYLFYIPGYYQASFVLDNDVVARQIVKIPTNGWLGYLNNSAQNFPIYLQNKDLVLGDSLSFSTDFLENLAEQNYFNITLSHVVDSPNIDGSNFAMSMEMLKQFDFETSPCGVVTIQIIGLQGSIDFGFCNSGCVGDLTFNFNGQTVSAKENDLSTFGNISSQWMQVQVLVNQPNVRIVLDGRELLNFRMTKSIGTVGGISLTMDGSFLFRNITFRDHTDQILDLL